MEMGANIWVRKYPLHTHTYRNRLCLTDWLAGRRTDRKIGKKWVGAEGKCSGLFNSKDGTIECANLDESSCVRVFRMSKYIKDGAVVW